MCEDPREEGLAGEGGDWRASKAAAQSSRHRVGPAMRGSRYYGDGLHLYPEQETHPKSPGRRKI